jgi:Icc-related predicted phosphoesterase
VTRRLAITWDDPRPFQGRRGEPIRLLAASDEPDPTLEHEVNRAALGRIDLIIGCGDLSPDALAFLADALNVPLLFVRGNHDRRDPWPRPEVLPEEADGIDRRSLEGVSLVPLGWPGGAEPASDVSARRDEGRAWNQVFRVVGRRIVAPGRRPWIVFSHVPPHGVGDTPDDPYHVGFAAYRFALERLRPRLWLHGHTTRASQRTPAVQHGPTTVVNVTGSVLIELRPPS